MARTAPRLDWNELMTADAAGAAAFYGAVAGWGTRPWAAEPDHLAFTTSRGSAAGLMPLPAGAEPAWVPFARVADVDEVVRRAVDLGGRALRPPADAAGVGRWAILVDPQGAPLGLHAPSYTPREHGAPAAGEISRHELRAPDPAAALRFHAALLGWEGVVTPAPAGSPARWLCCIRVDDLEAAVARAVAAGATRVGGPDPRGEEGAVAILADPGGVPFGLHRPAAPGETR